MPTAKKAPAKKATAKRATKTGNVTIKNEGVKELANEEPVRRPGRPPKPKMNDYSCTVYSNGTAVNLKFDSLQELEAAFVQICHKPLTGRPATVKASGKIYTFLKVDYLVKGE
tara:strand:- start:174 stop:512 length:339 start_codon:yes stop_codon:yes gene_type:complete